jgi:Thermolysin metallopeptidase, catalytic domain/Fungalysin/Thermolysin Propeptide Motif
MPPKRNQQFTGRAGTLGLLVAFAALGAAPSPVMMVVGSLDESATTRREFPPAASGSVFLEQANLGVLPPTDVSFIGSDPERVKIAAASTLETILKEHYGYSGEESLIPVDQPIRYDDNRATAHVRYQQLVDGSPLEGASIALHFQTRTGSVYAVNGEVHSQASIDETNFGNATLTPVPPLTCEAALDLALLEFGQSDPGILESGTWQGECQSAAVQGRDGKPYVAYKRPYGYQPSPMSNPAAPYQLDVIFAQRSTGRLVAIHPTIFSERAMDTRDCGSSWVSPDDCAVVTTSPNKILTGDEHVDNIHNFTVDVYDMYARKFGFASMDGHDMKIVSLAHYGSSNGNAFFSSQGYLVYGDGDPDAPMYPYYHFGQMDVSELD